MDEITKMNKLLQDIGQEIVNEKLEQNCDAEFDGFQDVKEKLLQTFDQQQEQYAGNISDYELHLHNRSANRKRKTSKKRRVAVVAILAAVLGMSLTAYAAVKHFILHEDLVGNGEYNLDVEQEEGSDKVAQMQPVRIITNYIPEGFVSNEADYMEKYRIYPANGDEFSDGGITIWAEPATDQTISITNVTDSEDAVVGKYDAKILTTFMEDGTKGYDVMLIDQEAGYLFTIYGMDSGLSLDELKKIGENLSYEIVEDAEPIIISEMGGTMMEDASSVAGITEENIFGIDETKQDVVAKDAAWAEQLAQQGADVAAAAQVEYTIDSIEVMDQAAGLDLENGFTNNGMYQEHIQEDGTILPRIDTVAQLNEETGKVETTTEEHPRKFVLATVILHNPTDVNISNYFFTPNVYTLTSEGNSYRSAPGTSFNEPLYLSFADYDGKAGYQMSLVAGETRTVVAGYVVDESEIKNAYLKFNSLGIGDASGTCWDNYVKIKE